MHTDYPAMIRPAVTEISGVRYVHDPVHESQRASFFLHSGGKSRYSDIHIHRPAGMVAPVSTFKE